MCPTSLDHSRASHRPVSCSYTAPPPPPPGLPPKERKKNTSPLYANAIPRKPPEPTTNEELGGLEFGPPSGPRGLDLSPLSLSSSDRPLTLTAPAHLRSRRRRGRSARELPTAPWDDTPHGRIAAGES